MAGTGLETRTTILPSPSIPIKTPGIFGPDYSFSDNVKLPHEVGVRDGDSMDSVFGALGGAAYYLDTIGFGESSTGLSRGLGVKPLGVNSFLRTGFKCSNGAEMWTYSEGIPTGNALGKRVKDGLAGAGLPAMRGLAPGILEDAQSALDPSPVLGAIFGSGYPKCKFVTLPVGDQDGKIQNPSTKAYYVDNPETVVNGKQGRWVQDSDLSQEDWKNAPKTHCPNGYLLANHRDSDCAKELISTKQGFCGQQEPGLGLSPHVKLAITAAAVIGGLAYIRFLSKKRFT
jgi:hypothetical protein